MRLIPGKTKVQVELFKGVSLWDMLIVLIAAVLVVFVLTSSFPGKLYIIIGVVVLAAILLVRLDEEPNYIYLTHMLRHFGYKRRFVRKSSESALVIKEDEGTKTDGDDQQEAAAETPAQRKARIKAEKAERKADDKILKNRNTTKEEADAIWLKRARQSASRKQARKSGNTGTAYDMSEIIGFTGIKDDFIEYGGEYYGAVIEIPPVEFRFFSENRRVNSIESAVGRVLRSLHPDYAANIVKLERPTDYSEYIENEYKKIAALRSSYERGVFTEEEFKSRIGVLCDRINDLNRLCVEEKVIQPFFYIVLFDSDKTQLTHTVSSAVDTLGNGEISARRLGTKELAVFLKYSNQLDFDEHDIEYVAPEKYAEWAMPSRVNMTPRTANIDGITTYTHRVVNYPSLVNDAWLASVMSLPATKVVVKCKPMDRAKAVRGIDRSLQELRGQFMATGVDSKRLELQEHIDTLASLLSTLQGDNESLLEVNVYVTSYDAVATRNSLGEKGDSFRTSRASINNMKRVVRRIYQENGLRLTNMEFDQVNGFIASQIHAWDPLGAKGRGMPSNSVAAGYPWVFAHISDKNGIKLGTADGVPVFIDFFRRDSERVNSNMVIVGKSGSGKSYATKSLLTNLAADDSKIFILDPENEYTELAANLHGKFINVGNAQYGRLNPFHIITALDDDESSGGVSGSYATHLQFLEEFFRQILPDCEKDAMEYLNSIIDRMYTNMGITAETDLHLLTPEDYPTFDDLYDSILSEFQSTDNEYIRTMLRTLMNYVAKFSAGGRNANIWNGPSTVTTEENFTVFNFQSLLANRNGAIANAQMLLVLKYIDNEIIKNRDYNTKYKVNRKIVVVIDEAHVFIDTKFPVALDFMFQLAKRIRKYNGMQIVITQNIKDFVGSEEIARKSTAIINACQYSFIFSLAPNDMEDLCKLYEKAGGINENEQEQIISAPRGQAFTVMSPQSRSTFKVEVPSEIVGMFQDQGFESKYFDEQTGENSWDTFVGDSRSVHEMNANARQDEISSKRKEGSEEEKSHVTFMEITEEEYLSEKGKASVKHKTTHGRTVLTDGKADAKETISDIPDEDDIPEIPENPEDFIKMKNSAAADREVSGERQDTVISPAEQVRTVYVDSSAASGKTEKLLSELLGKFSYDAMLQEIKRSVREELGKGSPAAASAATEAPADKVSLGSVFNDQAIAQVTEEAIRRSEVQEQADAAASGLSDTDTGNTAVAPVSADAEDAGTAETNGEEGGFDIMAMLMMEARNMTEMSSIDMMEEYGEVVLEITLEELIQYNAKHR